MLLTKIAAPIVFAATALAQTFSVNTPASLIQCQPAQITWVGGTSPYIMAALPGGQATAPAIAGIATGLTSSPYTWNVNLASGLNITIRLTDNTGAIAYSSPLVIQAGVSNSCLNASASTSGLTTVPVTTTGSGSTTLTSTTSAAPTTSTTSAPGSSMTSMMSSMMSSMTSMMSSSTSRPATSAAASSSTAWAMPTAVAGVPAIAMAAIGGLAALL